MYDFRAWRFFESSEAMVVLRKLSFAIAACVLLGEVGVGSLRAQSLLQIINNVNERFDFHHYESLPKDSRVKEAQAEVERLFPPGSSADDFEAYFRASGAKCSRGTDFYGAYFLCDYSMPGFFLVVTTDWLVVARPDPTLSKIATVLVTRDLTGL
jgi:hypothetical protein